MGEPTVILPPRQQAVIEIREKVKRGEPITQQEQRLLILALPRKVRRTHKIRTPPIRAELDALKTMALPGEAADVKRKAKNKAKAARRKTRAVAEGRR